MTIEVIDVDYEHYIIRTAQRIIDLGLDGVKLHIEQAHGKALETGFNFNAYMQMSLSDYASAEILVKKGLGDSVLKRMGMWRIGEFTYYTGSNKWNTKNSKTYYAKSLEHFVDKYVLKVDKK